MPPVNRLYSELRSKGLEVRLVSFREDAAMVKRTAAERGYAAPVLIDRSGDVTGIGYGVFGPPTAFSTDGRRAVVGGYGQPVVIDVEEKKVLAKFTRNAPGGDAGVSLSADGKRLAIGGSKSFDAKEKDKGPTVVVWDVDE